MEAIPDPGAVGAKEAGGPLILILAGESSGDQHGGALAAALRERWPGAELVGLGGPRMADEGVELLAELDDLAVMGFVEILSRLPFFWRLERKIVRLLDERDVDLVIPIDYPGFNLRVARKARERGVPVLYYIAPQVWAWHRSRVRRLARDTAVVAVILPFEVSFFEDAGVRAEFVGHPLLDRDDELPGRDAFLRGLGLDPGRPVLALFPGSRRQEVDRHLSPFVEAAGIVRSSRPDVQVVVARAEGLPSGAYADAGEIPRTRESRALLRHARAGLVKSGTTTLEASLEETPFVVAYRTHPVTFLLARHLVEVDHIALANLVAGERVVPELIQDAMTPERLADHVQVLLDEDDPEREAVLRGLSRIRDALGEPGCARRVAALADELLDRPAAEGVGP